MTPESISRPGYFIVPKKFEVAVRVAEFDPNSDVDDNERTENGVASTGSRTSTTTSSQADYRLIEDKARANSDDKEFRLQYQLIF